MAAQAQFSESDVNVQPGEAETLTLTLVNLGNRTETFTLIPAGLVAGWVRLAPPSVTLFGGSMEKIKVTLRPPQLASTPAGPAPLTVRVIPQDEPDDVVIAETTVMIGAFHDRRLHLLQPVARSRRRATFEFLLENQGNSQASCRLHLIDTSRRLDGDFDPPAVGVEPGGRGLVRLRMKAVRRHWRGGSRTLPFSIEADQQGFPTAVANATFIQTPAIPERLGRKFLALVLVAAALVGTWFGVLRPATERAAKDAVRRLQSTIVTTTLPGARVPTVTTAGPAPTPTSIVANDGVPFSKTFTVTVGPTQSASDQFVVPNGKELRITDYGLQNPNLDGGTATLSKNDGAPLQIWNLSLIQGNEDRTFRSPIVFEAGQTVTFNVMCDNPGRVGLGKCVTYVFVSGTLVDV